MKSENQKTSETINHKNKNAMATAINTNVSKSTNIGEDSHNLESGIKTDSQRSGPGAFDIETMEKEAAAAHAEETDGRGEFRIDEHMFG
jgi:hypothetical protein